MLDDETLRDGLQSPSVRTPTIDEKIGILHHMDALGIDTADIGLPGAGPKRICVADTVGHATPNGAKAVVTFVKSLIEELGVDAGIDWHGHRDRGFGVASSIAALEAGASRLHGAALGIGERCGNTPIDLLMVNLVMMGYRDNDLSSLPAYAQAVAAATALRT